MRRVMGPGVACGLAILLTAATAAAQARAGRPYRGLFGGGVGNAEQLMSVSFSGGGGYDGDILAGAAGTDPTEAHPQKGGPFSGGGGSLSYSLKRDRVTFGASGGTSARYYGDLPKPFVFSHSAQAQGTFQLAKRLQLAASGQLLRQPFNSALQGLLRTAPAAPSLVVPVVIDEEQPDGPELPADQSGSIGQRDYMSWSSSAGISYSFGRNSSASFGYSTQVSELQTGRRQNTQNGHGGITFGLTKGLGLRIGYGYTRAGYDREGGTRTVTSQAFDGGLDYSHALSLTRRTHLTFSTGTAGVSDGQRTQYRLTGNATLMRELGRTWQATLGYSRDVGFIDLLIEPTLLDLVSGGVNGLVGRGLEFQANVAAARGSVGFAQADNGTVTYRAGSGLRWGFTRYLSLDLNYAYYHHFFESGVVLPPGVRRESNRQMVTINASLWAPIFQRARRPHAAR